jgi:hypothetical protein
MTVMERQTAIEAGWFPLQGSYEEAVLSWHEQVEMSFRRRALEAQRTGQATRVRPIERKSVSAVSD